MGYLKSIGTTIIYTGLFLAVITFLPGLPPDAEFSEYSIVLPAELDGKQASNNRLNDAEILFKGELHGPESFASYGGELYTGIHGGSVVKIAGKQLVRIAKFGKDCDAFWEEKECGRPLGLKFDKAGALYVADSYYGIFKVNVRTGDYKQIVDISKPIEGVVPKICNSLDIASNGDIYWSDSSSDFSLLDGVYTMLVNPSGRLMRYNAATKRNEVLVQYLGFANGVQLNQDESFVLVSETLTSRITRYNIKGPKAGRAEPFVQGLPGLPDNIHSDGQDGFLVSLVVYADVNHPQLFQSFIPHPYIRKMLVRFFTLIEAPFKLLEEYYPNYYSKRIIHAIGSFESLKFMTPSTVTVLRVDRDGKVVDALYATDEKIAAISSAYIHKDFLWLGSPYNEYIARVPLKQAFPDMVVREKQYIAAEKSVPSSTTAKPATTTTPRPVTTTTTPKPATTTTPKPSTTTTPKPTPAPTTPPPKVVTKTAAPIPKSVPTTPKPTPPSTTKPTTSAPVKTTKSPPPTTAKSSTPTTSKPATPAAPTPRETGQRGASATDPKITKSPPVQAKKVEAAQEAKPRSKTLDSTKVRQTAGAQKDVPLRQTDSAGGRAGVDDPPTK